MKRNWTKKLTAGLLSLAMVFTAAVAVWPGRLQASASQAAIDPDVPQNQGLPGRISVSMATRTV
ncbi:MAG: hypothetical protein ACLSAP_07840 [Oscillospiraceae bacterium]